MKKKGKKKLKHSKSSCMININKINIEGGGVEAGEDFGGFLSINRM